MDAVAELGCVVCRVQDNVFTPAQVHHILRNGKRIDHMHVLPLCASHHNSGVNNQQYVSRHPWRVEFQKRYGSEMDLLAKVREMVTGG